VAFGIHFFEDVLDLAVRADQECGPGDSHDLLPVHVFFFHYAILATNLLVAVGKQSVGQAVFFLKLLLLLRRIGGDSQDDCGGLLNFLVCVTEPGRLNRSTRRVGFRKEEQHHGLAAEVLERDVLAILVGQSELRSFIMDMHGLSFLW